MLLPKHSRARMKKPRKNHWKINGSLATSSFSYSSTFCTNSFSYYGSRNGSLIRISMSALLLRIRTTLTSTKARKKRIKYWKKILQPSMSVKNSRWCFNILWLLTSFSILIFYAPFISIVSQLWTTAIVLTSKWSSSFSSTSSFSEWLSF